MTRTALVTGANRGIGRAVADRLAADGVAVCGLYRAADETAEDLDRSLRAAPTPGFAHRCDVSVEADVRAALERCGRTFGHLDVVVNNAGIAGFAPLADLDRATWDEMLAVNLTGPYLVTRAALGLLADGGSLISITSGLGVVGAPGKSHYAASKAALIGFTRSLSRELGPRGIRVNAVAPGIVETEMAAAGLSPALRARYEGQCALGRTGRPEELADVVAFLAGTRSSYVSGQVLMVDGGM